MKSHKVTEEYNITATDMIEIFNSDDYYNYLVKYSRELKSFNFILLEKVNNIIYMKIIYEIYYDLPKFLKSVVTSLNGTYYVNEDVIYNLEDYTINVKVNSKSLDLISSTFKYNYDLKNIDDKVEKNIYFNFNCSIPIIGYKIEEWILQQIVNTSYQRRDLLIEYINEEFKKSN